MPQSARPNPSREKPVAERLPYARLVDDITVETRDARLMQVIRLRGLPFETADTDELNYRKVVRETMLRAIADPRFAIYHHIVRRTTQPAHEGVFDDAFSRDLDQAWRTRLSQRSLFVNELYLTLIRRPLQGQVGFLEGMVQTLRGAGDAQGEGRDGGDR